MAPSWLGKHSQLFEPHISLIVQFAVVAHRVIWLMKATRASAAALHQLASVLVNRFVVSFFSTFSLPLMHMGNIWYMPHIIGAGLSSRAAAELGLLPGTTVRFQSFSGADSDQSLDGNDDSFRSLRVSLMRILAVSAWYMLTLCSDFV